MNDVTFEHADDWGHRVYTPGKQQVGYVKIRHWTRLDYPSARVVNCWCLYATFYDTHSMFGALKLVDPKRYYDSEAAGSVPMHGGQTYHKRELDESGAVVGVTVGCDYQHLHDERFAEYATLADAYEVESDARQLVEFVRSRA